MAADERVVQVIYSAIDDVNRHMEKEDRLKKSQDTALFGASGSLDSLGFVNLLVAVEQRIEEEFGTTFTLADERAMSRKNSPFRTVGTLADYIAALLKQKE